MPVDRSAVPLVAVEFMNQDHHAAVDLLNAIETALVTEPLVEADVEAALRAFLDHTREHFGREEEEMRRTLFPVYPVHKGEHDRVLADMEVVAGDWAADPDAAELLAWVRGPLPEWLVEHIETMDTITAAYIANAG
jgi:hemerythrin